MENDRIKNTTRNMWAGFIYRIINLLFPFGINTIIIKTLGVDYLGLNMLFASILQVLSLSELGFGTALVFSMYEPIVKKDYKKISAFLGLYRSIYKKIGVVIIIGGIGCMPILPTVINGEVPNELNIYILFAISLINTVVDFFLYAYRSALLYAYQRKDIIEKINIIIEFLLNVSKILILITTKNYYLFCILVPVFTVINRIWAGVISKKMFPNINCEGNLSENEKKSVYSRVIGISLHRICYVVSNSFDSIIISSILGIKILGQYTNYFVIGNALSMLLLIVTTSASSSIGNSIVCESKEKNYRDFNTFQFGYSIISGWASICLACLSQPFVKLWVGEELMFDDVTAIIFAVFLYSRVSGSVFMTYREAAGIWAHDRVRPFVEAVLNLSMNIILVKVLGVCGVLLSTIFTNGLIQMVWASRYLYKEYFTEYSHAKYLLKQLLYLMVTVFIGIITYFICSYISIEGFVGLIIKGVVSVTVSVIMYIVIYCRTTEFKRVLCLGREMISR